MAFSSLVRSASPRPVSLKRFSLGFIRIHRWKIERINIRRAIQEKKKEKKESITCRFFLSRYSQSFSQFFSSFWIKTGWNRTKRKTRKKKRETGYGNIFLWEDSLKPQKRVWARGIYRYISLFTALYFLCVYMCMLCGVVGNAQQIWWLGLYW